MADNTKIEWTDATWNPVTGCSVATPGCTNCYAMKLAGTRLQHHPSRQGLTRETKAGPVWTGEVRFNEQWLTQPLQWRRPRRIFVCAHGDLFHEYVPDDWIARVFAVMALAPHHQFQVLTKRSARMRDYMETACGRIADTVMRLRRERGDTSAIAPLPHVRPGAAWWPLPNVWLGVSAEDQARAEERREDLRATPAAVRFVSYEPALGPVDWTGWEFLDWLISGGESGPKARPAHPDWFREARDFCGEHEIAYLHKQNGEFAPGEIAGDHLDPEKSAKGMSLFDGRWDECWSEPEGHVDDEPDVYRIGKKAAGRLLDGVEHNGFPQVRA